MIRVAVAPFEVEIKSSILTQRGGTDANAPERLRTVGSPFFGMSGKASPK